MGDGSRGVRCLDVGSKNKSCNRNNMAYFDQIEDVEFNGDNEINLGRIQGSPIGGT